MKRFILCFLFLVILFTASSQKVYFVYLQSEQEQPFFVKMNDKVLSSTASGYLILSKLHDSSYNFTIGFPQNKWPEKSFSVSVNHKDHGFLLKNFGEDGWGLFDLQNMSVQMAKSNERADIDIKKEPVKKDESVFTQILAKASDDSTLLEKPDLAQIKEEKKEVLKQPEQKVEEKKMFGGLCFMVNDKMCVGVESQRLMVRLDPNKYDEVIEKDGCGPMDFTGKIMKGYVFVDIDALHTKKKLEYWVNLALDYNKIAKVSKKKKPAMG